MHKALSSKPTRARLIATMLCLLSATASGNIDSVFDDELDRSTLANSAVTYVPIGDFNGDGLADFARRANYDNYGSQTQSAHVLFGYSALEQSQAGNGETLDGINGFVLASLQTGFGLGRIAAAGDVNGDGIDDIIVGSPRYRALDRRTAGAGFVVFGSASGFPAVVDVDSLDGSNGFAIYGPRPGALAGTYLDGNGDINGDGLSDLIVESRIYSPVFNPTNGLIHVVYGRKNYVSPSIDLAQLNAAQGFTITGTRNGGSASPIPHAEFIHDFNGDGRDELLYATHTTGRYGLNEKVQLNVVYGGQRLQNQPATLDALRGNRGFRINHGDGARTNYIHSLLTTANATSGYFRNPAAKIFDLNDDGFSDIVYTHQRKNRVGDPSGLRRLPKQEFVLFGRADPMPLQVTDLYYTPSTGLIINNDYITRSDHESIRAARGVGDVNGDGIDDLWTENGPGSFEREGAIVFGKRCSYSRQLHVDNIDGSNGFTPENYVSLTTQNDLNGDGFSDWLVEYIETTLNGRPRYESRFVFGRPPTTEDMSASADFGFSRNLEGSDPASFTLRGREYGFRTTFAGKGTAVVLNPRRGARLWHPHDERFAIAGDLSINARVRLASAGYSPVVAKYARINVRGKAVPAYALETLDNGAVRFSWLREGQRRIDSCTTAAGVIQARRHYEMTATRGASSGIARIWVNGRVKKVCRGTPGQLDTTVRNLFIGSWPKGLPAGKAVMELDDLKIYSRVLEKRSICY